MPKTLLNQQETIWLAEKRIKRLTDQHEVQIYPMGAERHLSAILFENSTNNYDIKQFIQDKRILIIPGHGNSGFLFANAGAKSLTVCDKDPVTVAWIKAFKKYYHFRERTFPSIAELFTALTAWYPPLLTLPSGNQINRISWLCYPQALRKSYLHYLLHLIQRALSLKPSGDFELDKEIHFHVGTLDTLKEQEFDTVFVPYLLGVRNGIENEEEILSFMQHLFSNFPRAKILVTPAHNQREYGWMGRSYFVTTPYQSIETIPGLQAYLFHKEEQWFHHQGLAVFCAEGRSSTCFT